MKNTVFLKVAMVQEDPISSKTFTFAAENFLPVSESFSHDSETLIIL